MPGPDPTPSGGPHDNATAQLAVVVLLCVAVATVGLALWFR